MNREINKLKFMFTKKRYIWMRNIITILLLSCLLFISGCRNNEINVSGKVYTYEKEGMGGDFSIYINEDGTYTYYEGMLSSYIGIGTWSIKNSKIILKDDDEMGFAFINHFEIDGDNLIFIEEESDNFLYVKVKDEEVFRGIPFYSEEPQVTTILLEK